MASTRAVNISPTPFLVLQETVPSHNTEEDTSTCRPCLFIETEDKSPEAQAYEEALLLEEFLRNNTTPLQQDISGATFKQHTDSNEIIPGIIRVSSKKTLNRVVSFSTIVEKKIISPRD
jgi:hypothetical protein